MKKIYCSGVLFFSKTTRRFLLLQKDHGKQKGLWSIVGGTNYENESAWQGLKREVIEEIGFEPPILKSIPLETFVSDDLNFQYQTYLCIVENEFIPLLSEEHSSWGWSSFDCWPKPMHLGLRNTLNNRVIQSKIETVFQILDLI